jgi:uncharacterized protein (UPF0303 family)
MRQEDELVFDVFDEDMAIRLLGHARDLAKDAPKGVGIMVRFWDRILAFGGTRGFTHGNFLWCERKTNTVRLVHKSSYRVLLEEDGRKVFEDRWGVSAEDYAISGGAFPIRVRGAGVVGAAAMSGLHERMDHELIVAAIVRTLGRKPEDYALAP